MPLGFERLNERTQRPNANINFIKTVSTGADKAIALEFLSRIAAQCYPVMKKHYITVMALEEYPPNPEFLGRNFNAGEAIQLVLKDKQGRWLSFKFVQMVLMHELAHCKQMNHSKFFWGVRNEYAKQMEDLWKEKYEGEGMWGRGRGLQNGAFVHAQPPDNTQIPEHLCGGSYRRRGKKRKRGSVQNRDGVEMLSYAERQQKRIQKKLGKHGVSMRSEVLGDDELTRGALETMNGGKRAAGKPRVANSKRGRELRANAALARFEALKQQTPEKTPEFEEDLDSETESEWEDGSTAGSRGNAIVVKDEHGHDMVKVCGDGEDDEEGAGREMDELRMLSRGPGRSSAAEQSVNAVHKQPGFERSETESEADDGPAQESAEGGEVGKVMNAVGVRARAAEQWNARPAGEDQVTTDNVDGRRRREIAVSEGVKNVGNCGPSRSDTAPSTTRNESPDPIDLLRNPNAPSTTNSKAPVPPPDNRRGIAPPVGKLKCPICSLENDPGSPTCIACSHVLCPRLMPRHWTCWSPMCRQKRYINAGDAGRCGLCGRRREEEAVADTPPVMKAVRANTDTGNKANGLTGSEVLRWD